MTRRTSPVPYPRSRASFREYPRASRDIVLTARVSPRRQAPMRPSGWRAAATAASAPAGDGPIWPANASEGYSPQVADRWARTRTRGPWQELRSLSANITPTTSGPPADRSRIRATGGAVAATFPITSAKMPIVRALGRSHVKANRETPRVIALKTSVIVLWSASASASASASLGSDLSGAAQGKETAKSLEPAGGAPVQMVAVHSARSNCKYYCTRAVEQLQFRPGGQMATRSLFERRRSLATTRASLHPWWPARYRPIIRVGRRRRTRT